VLQQQLLAATEYWRRLREMFSGLKPSEVQVRLPKKVIDIDHELKPTYTFCLVSNRSRLF